MCALITVTFFKSITHTASLWSRPACWLTGFPFYSSSTKQERRPPPVAVQCHITLTLQTCSTGSPTPSAPSLVQTPPLHATSLFPAGKCFVKEEMTSQHPNRPQTHWNQMRTKCLSGVFWLRPARHGSAAEAKTSRPWNSFWTALRRMSAGHNETAREPPRPSGTAAFFSNPLMSGE